MDIRYEDGELGLTTNLVVHYSIMNISNHTIEHICILDIGKESLNLPLLCQWNELLENLFQFPNSLYLLSLDLSSRRSWFTVAAHSSLFSPLHHPQEQVCRVCQRGLQLWVPMTSLLGYLHLFAGCPLAL